MTTTNLNFECSISQEGVSFDSEINNGVPTWDEMSSYFEPVDSDHWYDFSACANDIRNNLPNDNNFLKYLSFNNPYSQMTAKEYMEIGDYIRKHFNKFFKDASSGEIFYHLSTNVDYLMRHGYYASGIVSACNTYRKAHIIKTECFKDFKNPILKYTCSGDERVFDVEDFFKSVIKDRMVVHWEEDLRHLKQLRDLGIMDVFARVVIEQELIILNTHARNWEFVNMEEM